MTLLDRPFPAAEYLLFVAALLPTLVLLAAAVVSLLPA